MSEPKLTPQIVAEWSAKARADPVWWMTKFLGSNLWPLQARICEMVRDTPEVAVASCHGTGKSYLAARIALWFLLAHPESIVITTAPTDRQVRGILWKEIGLAHHRARVPLGGKLLTQELHVAKGWYAWGFTAPDYDPDRFQGFHSKDILVIVDEACGVTQAIYDGIDGVLSSEHSRCLLIGNPTDPASPFAATMKRAGVAKLTIGAWETPNFTSFGITEDDIIDGTWSAKVTGPLPYPSLVTPDWAARMAAKWGGRGSPLYEAKIAGRFPEAGTDTLIPLSWVMAAQERELDPGEPVELVVDVARYGGDESVIGVRRGAVVRVVDSARKIDTMELVGRIVVQARKLPDRTPIKVDVVGIGAGVCDRLRELGHNVTEINAGSSPRDSERYINARAEWSWGLRERFDPTNGMVDIDPADDDLACQLSTLRYKIDSKGRIFIEAKEDMKKRGLPSPDRADMLAYAFSGIPRKVTNIRIPLESGHTGPSEWRN
jgi:phage terminase large subunit